MLAKSLGMESSVPWTDVEARTAMVGGSAGVVAAAGGVTLLGAKAVAAIGASGGVAVALGTGGAVVCVGAVTVVILAGGFFLLCKGLQYCARK